MIRDGMIIKGKVLRKSEGEIFVNINYKSEGVIPKEETSKYTYYDFVNEGDDIDVHVKRVETQDGFVVLSKIIADKKIVFGKVKNSFKDGGFIEGVVTKAVKGGFIIDFGANVTAFLPMSHSKAYGEDIVGKKLPLKIIQLDEEKRNVVVSYKEYVTEKDKTDTEAVIKIYPLNEKVSVTVGQVLPDGIEVEKELMKVFIPFAELSWKASSTPEEEGFKEGDIIDVMVVNYEKGRAQLSLKRLKENPFKSFSDNFKPGDRLDAVVKEIFPEGVSVSVNEGLEGFVPLGELSYFRRIKDASVIYKKSDVIKTCVLKIDEIKNRVILSVKRLEKNPWNNMEERYPVGARVFGTIRTLIDGEGAEIELEENIDAFLHTSNISWNVFTKISEVLVPGEKKEFKIMEIDKSKYKIMLGLKQMHASPWTIFTTKYKEGAYIDAKITAIDEASVTVLLAEGVVSKISIRNHAKLRNKIGDVIKVKINKIDIDSKKIFLIAKDLEATEEQKQIDDYIKTHDHNSFKLNDIINFNVVDKGDENAK
ncbi:MAG: S1 RNA-binding domain-containing protein [bacterium]